MALIRNISDDLRQRISTILALSIVPLSGFATDVYIPSMPSMAGALDIASLQVQLTLSIFLISYGIAQLFVGTLLDSFGRYKLGLTALFVFALANIIIAKTNNINVIYAMRVIHGIAVAIVVVGKRAYFVDVYKDEQLKNYLSTFTIIWSVGPIIAPFIGGYLQSSFGWHSNFYFLAIMAGILACLELLFTRETLKNPLDFNLKKISITYLEMISNSTFTLGLVMLGLAYSMIMIYNLTGSFIIEHTLELSPVIIGYSSLFLGFAWTAGGLVGKATINRPFTAKITVNLILQLAAGLLMLLSIGRFNSLFVILFFAFLIHSCAGYTFNNYFTYNLSQFPKNAGIAGGLIGGVVYVIVSFLSYIIVGILPAKDERNLNYSYLILIIISVLTISIASRLKKIKE